MKIHQSLIIEQRVHKVFEYLSDFSLAGLWNSLIFAFEPLNPGESIPAVGYCYKQQHKLLNQQWEVSYQIVEYERDRRITSKTTTGWLPGMVTYHLEPQREATQLIYQYELELVKFLEPFEDILQKSLERQTTVDLANLKDWLESGLYPKIPI